jgi:four helix bundle protein
MRCYRRFAVYMKADSLARRIYETSAWFPAEERFGLVPQVRRAATSIPINVAEGAGREPDADFARFSEHRDWLSERT